MLGLGEALRASGIVGSITSMRDGHLEMVSLVLRDLELSQSTRRRGVSTAPASASRARCLPSSRSRISLMVDAQSYVLASGRVAVCPSKPRCGRRTVDLAPLVAVRDGNGARTSNWTRRAPGSVAQDHRARYFRIAQKNLVPPYSRRTRTCAWMPVRYGTTRGPGQLSRRPIRAPTSDAGGVTVAPSGPAGLVGSISDNAPGAVRSAQSAACIPAVTRATTANQRYRSANSSHSIR